MRYLVAVVAIMMLLACGSDDPMTGPEGPPEYRQGYAHGCASALFEAGVPNTTAQQDEARYAEDPLYKQGWDDGQADCPA